MSDESPSQAPQERDELARLRRAFLALRDDLARQNTALGLVRQDLAYAIGLLRLLVDRKPGAPG